jgi:predicted ATPase
VGKTRLALDVARAELPWFEDGVTFVGLAALQDPALVARTIAEALGIKESGSVQIEDVVTTAVADRQCLLVVDNFEHVIDAVPLIGRLLSAAPELKVLVTSRTTLRLSGEYEYVVPPLHDEEAVELFVRRAEAAGVVDPHAGTVAAICRQPRE